MADADDEPVTSTEVLWANADDDDVAELASGSKPPTVVPVNVIRRYRRLVRQLAAFYAARARNTLANGHVKRLHDELWAVSPGLRDALQTVTEQAATLAQLTPVRRRAFEAAVSAIGDILLDVPTLSPSVLNLLEHTGPPDLLPGARAAFVAAQGALTAGMASPGRGKKRASHARRAARAPRGRDRRTPGLRG
jgi:hypothetical protein